MYLKSELERNPERKIRLIYIRNSDLPVHHIEELGHVMEKNINPSVNIALVTRFLQTSWE